MEPQLSFCGQCNRQLLECICKSRTVLERVTTLDKEESAVFARVKSRHDQAVLVASALLRDQEEAAAVTGRHRRWERQCDALKRSLLQAGQLGLGVAGWPPREGK